MGGEPVVVKRWVGGNDVPVGGDGTTLEVSPIVMVVVKEYGGGLLLYFTLIAHLFQLSVMSDDIIFS